MKRRNFIRNIFGVAMAVVLKPLMPKDKEIYCSEEPTKLFKGGIYIVGQSGPELFTPRPMKFIKHTYSFQYPTNNGTK